MATTSFRIAVATVTAEPAQPAAEAWPTTEGGAPVVRYPKPQRRDGNGAPAGIVGLPWCEFGRHRIAQAGITFYNNLFAAVTDESVAVKCKLYDARSASWKVYSGRLWRPTIGEAVRGKAYTFHNFKASITDLVELAGWT